MNSQITERKSEPLVVATIRTFFPNTKFLARRVQISDIPMARLKLANHIIHWYATYPFTPAWNYRLPD